MNTYNISLNKELAELVDKQVKEGGFANRSEFFRQLLRHAFFSKTAEDTEWIYENPFHKELKNRALALKSGKEKLYSAKEFDKEFNF